MNSQLEFLDIITIVSFVLQAKNYSDNTMHNNITNISNKIDRQNSIYLEKIAEKQEEILDKINSVIKILEEVK